MDNYKIPINIYIDLLKAFDKLNFYILVKKLDQYDTDTDTDITLF